jgi:hypothetical protein
MTSVTMLLQIEPKYLLCRRLSGPRVGLDAEKMKNALPLQIIEFVLSGSQSVAIRTLSLGALGD